MCGVPFPQGGEVVDFDPEELVRRAIAALDAKLNVSKIYFKVERGVMKQIRSKDDLLTGASFVRKESVQYGTEISASNNGNYDLKAQRHLYDHIIYDSTNEKTFAEQLDTNKDVAVYVKLPSGFYISIPVGKYNPDWAIAFYEGSVKHIYFVAETKGTLDTMKLNHITLTEQAKIDCAEAHFKAISRDDAVYGVVDNYQALVEKVMR